MDVRPQDLPEIRAELSQQITDPLFIRPIQGLFKDQTRKGLQDGAASFGGLVDAAALFHVAAPMTDLVNAAAKSLDVFSPERTDLPAHEGLIIFDGDLKQILHMHDGCTTPLRGLLWGASDSNPNLLIMPIADVHEGVPASGRFVIYPSLFFTTTFGDRIENSDFHNGRCETVSLLALLLTSALLMQQPIAVTSTAEPDRAARKRLRRAGREPAPVRVIELRRPKNGGESSESDREYHHQWIVRGHWRQQWHPKRQVHRPVWIAPHIKGPEGAPLIGGEKVYALKR